MSRKVSTGVAPEEGSQDWEGQGDQISLVGIYDKEMNSWMVTIIFEGNKRSCLQQRCVCVCVCVCVSLCVSVCVSVIRKKKSIEENGFYDRRISG